MKNLAVIALLLLPATLFAFNSHDTPRPAATPRVGRVRFSGRQPIGKRRTTRASRKEAKQQRMTMQVQTVLRNRTTPVIPQTE